MTNDDKSRLLLKRVADEQSGPMSRPPLVAPSHDQDASDPVVIWGKRIGRIAGYCILIMLAINLATGWFF